MKINNTMKVFNFRKVDYLIKHNLKPVGAGYKNNEPYILFEGTEKFWKLFKMF